MLIAVVGQDSKFCLQLQDLLETQNHRVSLVPDVDHAFARLTADPVHLIVVDGLPSKDATLELIRTLRAHASTRQIPVLNVNPNGSAKEVVEVLDSGADDYLVKPFNGEIFLARVRTLLRRQIWTGTIQEDPVTKLECGDLHVHLVERVVRVAGEERALTRLEFDLLAYLVRNQGKVFKRVDLLEAVWKYPENIETRTLDKHIETLRKKLAPMGKCIRTVHGVGYRFLDPKSPLPQQRD
ncbi:MAG: response regulator transcription factor [Elusimicrobiota bacterium]